MSTIFGGEITRPSFPWRPHHGFVSYGLPFQDLLALHLERLSAEKVLLMVSGTFATHYTSEVNELRNVIGKKLVMEQIGMKPNTDWSECLEIAVKVRESKIEIIITLGGGNITDSAKLISLIAANNDVFANDLEPLHQFLPANNKATNPSNISIICIPTTLSGGEYSKSAVGVDTRDSVRKTLAHPSLIPYVVILDPALARSTPEWLWTSTGIRAIDHCVETLCRLGQPDEEIDINAKAALSSLATGLLQSKENPRDLKIRLNTQLAANVAMDAICQGIQSGGSHAISTYIGPLGVAHGYTSCITCPAVMAYNTPVNKHRQELVCDVFWSSPTVRSALQRRRLSPNTADLCTLLDGLFRSLKMPRTLHEVGIDPNDKTLDFIATNTLTHPYALSNPKPLKEKSEVLNILKAVI